MPERGWDSDCWTGDEWFQDLSRDQRYLFWYLSTNSHCNQAGLYYITLATMANETKFTKDELRQLLPNLEPKVKWYPDQNLVWVKNFIKRQSKSPKFLQAAAKSLTAIHHDVAVGELLRYNQQRYSISIPYRYYMDRVSIPSATGTATGLISDSLFSASLFSLDELNEALTSIKPGVDRLVDHEAIKQKLADIGKTRGYEVQSELATGKGRIDLCWLNNKGEIEAAFEIDFLTPRPKSLEKLKASGCPNAFIVLRKGKAKAEHYSHFVSDGEGRDQELATISKLYEDNIGMITPLVGDRLKDIASSYPPGWFKEALDEALGAGVRKLNYIEAILKRWETEGFKAGKVDKDKTPGPRGKSYEQYKKEQKEGAK